jgi:hypothetical protein
MLIGSFAVAVLLLARQHELAWLSSLSWHSAKPTQPFPGFWCAVQISLSVGLSINNGSDTKAGLDLLVSAGTFRSSFH